MEEIKQLKTKAVWTREKAYKADAFREYVVGVWGRVHPATARGVGSPTSASHRNAQGNLAPLRADGKHFLNAVCRLCTLCPDQKSDSLRHVRDK